MDNHFTVIADLHSLICPEWQKIFGIQLKSIFRGTQNIFKKIGVSILTERREAHDLAFVAVFRIADKLANSSVKSAQ